MQYEITIRNRTVRATVQRELAGEQSTSEAFRVAIPSHSYSSSWRIIDRSNNVLTLRDGARVFKVVQLRRSSTMVTFLVNGEEVVAYLNKNQGRTKATVTSSIASVDENVVSNFPAKVVKVSAAVGAKLEKDETLIVLEAMKMEAQIRVPRSCRVSEIFVSEGDMVERGKLLAKLKFEQS